MAQFELVKATDNTYFIDCPSKIGICRLSDGFYLIDSGNDKDAGRRTKKLLSENGISPKAVLTTHAHGDHIGGCRYLQDNLGVKVFSNDVELGIAAAPQLNPPFVWGGFPEKELRHKFLQAQQFAVSPFNDSDFPKDIEVLPLPGHTFNMVGFRTPDDVVFLADSLSSRETIDKYRVSFIYDVASYIETLNKIENMHARLFVPSHAEAAENIAPLAVCNREAVYVLAETIENMLGDGCSFEQLMKKLYDSFSMSFDYQQYALVGCTVRSYLAFLRDMGRAEGEFVDNRLIYRKI